MSTPFAISCHTRELPLVGPVTVAVARDGLCLLSLGDPQEARAYLTRRYPGQPVEEDAGPCAQAFQQIEEYLAGTRATFSLPLAVAGSEFQRRVWDAVAAIPYGSTRSYGQIAASVGKPTASRAVGAANGANRLCLVIPCHRVVGADGRLVGYAHGVSLKERLLELEARTAVQQAVGGQVSAEQ